MPRIRPKAGILASVIAVTLLGAGIYYRLRAEGAAEEESASAILAGAAPDAAANLTADITIPVTGAKAVRGTLIVSVNASGQAVASRETVVAPQVGGRIRALQVRENSAVGAGQVLFEIDPVEYELQYQEAQVALRNAQAEYESLTLFDDRITDPELRAERERFTRARSGLEAAELAVRRAEIELERTRVTAPIAGRVADVNAVVGEWVSAGAEGMKIVSIDPIRVDVQVLEGEVGYLTPGRGARISFAAFPGEVFQGRIETINPVVESGTRTARVTVLVPNPNGRILPGMYARVALDAREFLDRVMVPRTAILERDRRPMLFVFEGDSSGGRAKWRYVTPGIANETHVEILANVETDSVRAGETVLTDGHYTLIHDARVRLVEALGMTE